MKEFNESDALVHAVGLVRDLCTQLAEVTGERNRLREALLAHDKWRRDIGKVTFPDGTTIDLSDAYFFTSLYYQTEEALHTIQPEPKPEAPKPISAPRRGEGTKPTPLAKRIALKEQRG